MGVERLDDAISSFLKAIELGYDKKAVFDYGMSVAQAAGKNDTPLHICSEEHFLSTAKKTASTSVRLSTTTSLLKRFDKAFQAINTAIEQDPTNSQFLCSKRYHQRVQR